MPNVVLEFGNVDVDTDVDCPKLIQGSDSSLLVLFFYSPCKPHLLSICFFSWFSEAERVRQ